MIAVLAAMEYLGRLSDKFFEAQLKRAAIRIERVRSVFPISTRKVWQFAAAVGIALSH
jgi:hypothetical protein